MKVDAQCRVKGASSPGLFAASFSPPARSGAPLRGGPSNPDGSPSAVRQRGAGFALLVAQIAVGVLAGVCIGQTLTRPIEMALGVVTLTAIAWTAGRNC